MPERSTIVVHANQTPLSLGALRPGSDRVFSDRRLSEG